MTTILDALQKGTGYLEKHRVDGARLTMQLFLAHVLGCEKMQLYVDFDRPLDENQLAKLREIMKERAEGTPLQHLLGNVEFFGNTFLCDERALIPRPETEHLVDVLAKMPWPDEAKILDLGCGSGVIGLSIADALQNQRPQVTLADVSPEALSLAKENCEQLAEQINGCDVRLVQSDLFEQLSGQFHLIVANLPYISDADMATLSVEVQKDPLLALRGGPAGTELIERFFQSAGNHLEPGGTVAIEYGFGQEMRLEEVATSVSLQNVRILNDLEGRSRFLLAQRL